MSVISGKNVLVLWNQVTGAPTSGSEKVVSCSTNGTLSITQNNIRVANNIVRSRNNSFPRIHYYLKECNADLTGLPMRLRNTVTPPTLPPGNYDFIAIYNQQNQLII
jgi:hypothetical protein